MVSKKPKGKGGPPTSGFVPRFRHWRSGKVMEASDYGLKAWRFGPRKKRKG